MIDILNKLNATLIRGLLIMIICHSIYNPQIRGNTLLFFLKYSFHIFFAILFFEVPMWSTHLAIRKQRPPESSEPPK